MIREEIRVGVENLAINEREHAVREHGTFNSNHEAYAVTLEEVEETNQELVCMRMMMRHIWDKVRGDEDITGDMLVLKQDAINCACEAIQVAAMCDKYLTYTDK